MSQSIASDRISESTIARMAGNLLSGVELSLGHYDSSFEALLVKAAVKRARLIAAEVERTKSEGQV